MKGFFVILLVFFICLQTHASKLIITSKSLANPALAILAVDDSSAHLLLEGDLLDAVGLALADSNFSGMRDTLESWGYPMMLENSIGVEMDSSGDYFVAIGFNANDPDRTDQLFFMSKADESVAYTSYLSGTINSDGLLENVEEYSITDSGRSKEKKSDGDKGDGGGMTWKEYLACVGGGCAAAAVGCVASNGGYLVCLGWWCAGAAVGCGVMTLISNL
ncbi:MAG: hypothetical protein KFH87_00705 [Bacteroidetes bacterium]|nr:hypothetical protein [Bacteroidota bacterium]